MSEIEKTEFDNFFQDSQQKTEKDNKSQQKDNEQNTSKTNKNQQKPTLTKKTFYLDTDMMAMFKKIKEETGVQESFYLRKKLDEIFTKEFGEDWRDNI